MFLRVAVRCRHRPAGFFLDPTQSQSVSRSHIHTTYSATRLFFSLFILWRTKKKSETCEQFERWNKKKKFLFFLFHLWLFIFLRRWDLSGCFRCWGIKRTWTSFSAQVVSLLFLSPGIKNKKGKERHNWVRDKRGWDRGTCPARTHRLIAFLESKK